MCGTGTAAYAGPNRTPAGAPRIAALDTRGGMSARAGRGYAAGWPGSVLVSLVEGVAALMASEVRDRLRRAAVRRRHGCRRFRGVGPLPVTDRLMDASGPVVTGPVVRGRPWDVVVIRRGCVWF